MNIPSANWVKGKLFISSLKNNQSFLLTVSKILTRRIESVVQEIEDGVTQDFRLYIDWQSFTAQVIITMDQTIVGFCGHEKFNSILEETVISMLEAEEYKVSRVGEYEMADVLPGIVVTV